MDVPQNKQEQTADDGASAKLLEACTRFDPNAVTVEHDKHYQSVKVMEGNKTLIDFGDTSRDSGKAYEAELAAITIQHYGLNEKCQFGDGSVFLAIGPGGSSPLPGEDATKYDLSKVEVEKSPRWGTWQVAANHKESLLDFGNDKKAAETASEILHRYNLNTMGFVGRPNAPMAYFYSR